MASLTRKFLASIGIEDEKIDLIVEKHNEVLTEIKDERDKLKEDASKLPDVEKELEDLKSKISGEDPYKEKFEKLQKEFDDFKKDVDEKETTSKKESAFKKLLVEIGIPEKRIDRILKVSDIGKIELDDEGKIKDGDKLKESLKTEWSDFITTTRVEGVPSANPPSNSGKSTMTREQIRAISDPQARQKAMLENPTLFGLPETN